MAGQKIGLHSEWATSTQHTQAQITSQRSSNGLHKRLRLIIALTAVLLVANIVLNSLTHQSLTRANQRASQSRKTHTAFLTFKQAITQEIASTVLAANAIRQSHTPTKTSPQIENPVTRAAAAQAAAKAPLMPIIRALPSQKISSETYELPENLRQLLSDLLHEIRLHENRLLQITRHPQARETDTRAELIALRTLLDVLDLNQILINDQLSAQAEHDEQAALAISIQTTRATHIASISLLVILLPAVARFGRTLLSRLKTIRKTATRFSSGTRNARVQDNSGDEIGLLARDLNRMMEQIQSNEIRLQEQAHSLTLARDAAESAAAAKSAFLANMSHEIRTPMNAITGFGQCLKDPAATDAQRTEWVDLINRNSQQLLELINNILDLSKLDADGVELETQPVDLQDLIEDVCSTLRPAAEKKSIELHSSCVFNDTEIPNTSPWIMSDRLRLRQILMNLVGNSVKFTTHGRVEVQAFTQSKTDISTETNTQKNDEQELVLLVTDTGPGLPDVDIFASFRQADTSTTRRFGGSGLGLTISRQLAQLMQGSLIALPPKEAQTVDLRNKANSTETCPNTQAQESPGTRMQLVIPLKRPSAQQIQKAKHKLKAPEINNDAPLNLNILVAEDGLDNQRLIKFLLGKLGCRVTLVENGQQALDTVQQKPNDFDAVLMDMQMPVMDGYTATEHLRTAGHALPIIAVTAHALAGDRQACLDAGCSDYLSKPLSRPMLAQALQHGEDRMKSAA